MPSLSGLNQRGSYSPENSRESLARREKNTFLRNLLLPMVRRVEAATIEIGKAVARQELDERNRQAMSGGTNENLYTQTMRNAGRLAETQSVIAPEATAPEVADQGLTVDSQTVSASEVQPSVDTLDAIRARVNSSYPTFVFPEEVESSTNLAENA